MSKFKYLYVTPAASNILLAAWVFFFSAYLSDTYLTVFKPDCIITLAHSLHGKRETYMIQFLRL